MSNKHTIQEKNRELARTINEEVRTNPNSLYAGKFIGITDGQVVVVADSWDGVGRQLRQAKADPQRSFCFEAGADESAVEEIWGLP